MNTKTMRLPPRRVLRKERDGVISEKPSETTVKKLPPPPNFIPPPETTVKKLPPPPNFIPPPISRKSTIPVLAEPVRSNQLILAGYLSHEFLTNGTLFGEQWNPARAQADPFLAQSKVKPSHVSEPVEESEPKRKRYTEVANLLRSDGVHLPGIVNPAQLARFLKL